MANTGEVRKHDLLWAAIIVAGFAVMFGVVVLGMRGNGLTRRHGSELMTQVQAAIDRGDQALSDEYLDFGRAREEYRAAYDLLRTAGEEHDEDRADVQLRIVRSYMKERDFEKARDEVTLLQSRFPSFRPEEIALLHSHIEAQLK